MTSRVIRNQHDLEALLALLRERKLPFTIEVTDGRNRSVEANNLAQKWFSEISEQTGEDREDVRARCKLEIGVPIMREASEKFKETYDRLVRPLPYQDKLELIRDTDMPVTRLMGVKDMTRFMDLVFRRHSEFGVILTVPPDKYAYDPR
jgi:hypothetical protein